MNILLDKPGKIIAGAEIGRYVKVLNDADESGGYLILTAASPDMKNEGFDSWVGSLEEVAKYFEEAKWVVEW